MVGDEVRVVVDELKDSIDDILADLDFYFNLCVELT